MIALYDAKTRFRFFFFVQFSFVFVSCFYCLLFIPFLSPARKKLKHIRLRAARNLTYARRNFNTLFYFLNYPVTTLCIAFCFYFIKITRKKELFEMKLPLCQQMGKIIALGIPFSLRWDENLMSKFQKRT